MTDKTELTYPKSSLNLNLKIDGIYGFPEQWKTTDQANPGMFTYIVKFSNIEIPGGKILPRELTEKQLREQEQAKKKGGKKQAKKQENPAQAQKLRQQLQKEETEEKRKQELWNKMTEQQRVYYTNEDKYKSPSLRFENNAVEKTFNGNLFVVLEERITKDKGEWIYIYKVPTANEQDLQKLKKSKPKNLNLSDLNPVCMRAWVNLEKLNSSEVAEVHQLRCKIHQVDQTQQSPKPNLQKTYIKLSVTLSTPILQKPSTATVSSLIKDPPSPPQLPAEQKHLLQLEQQLNLAIQSLAMQYSSMFWKDLNANEQQKYNNVFVTNKKNQNNRRKQQFLYDFNVSGKYKVLKERLKKIIVHLCESKFSGKMEGGKSFTGITCSVRDQFYSEIYNFLVTSYSQTMSQLIQQKKHKLKQVFVLNSQTQSSLTQQTLQQYKKQSKQQRFNRIISEYILIQNYQYGRDMYKTAIQKNPQNLLLKYQYSIFCLKNGLANVGEVLGWGYIDQYVEIGKNDKDVVLAYVVFNIGAMQDKGFRKAWGLLRILLQEQPNNIRLLMLGVLTAELLGKTQAADKLKYQAYRQQLRKQSKIKQQGKHNTEPLPTQIPSLQSVATYKSQLTPQQRDQLWLQLIEQFSQFSMFATIQKIKQKLQNPETPKMKKQNIKILYYQQMYAQCKEKAIVLYKEAKDLQALKIVISCCEKLKEDQEKTKYLRVALTAGGEVNKQYALINLGLFYLRKQKYGNAKACLTKYLDGNKDPGGLSWMMLGQAELMCGNYQISVQCFRHSNLCDPYNKQIWLWLAQSYAKLRNYVMVNQCLNCYLQSQSDNKILTSKLHELRELLQKPIQSPTFYESSLKQKIVKKLQAY